MLTELGLQPETYFLVSAHREENVDSDDNFSDLMDSSNSIAETYKKAVIISTHPRTRKRLESRNLGDLSKRLQFLKPFGLLDYVKL